MLRRIGFRLRLGWQFSCKPVLARQDWFAGRLPWRVWCRLCAWNGESVVMELARRAGRPMHFVQIGSNDGVANDPLFQTAVAHRWTGLAVEPLPALFERLTANYRSASGVRTARVAIGREDGTASLYVVEPRSGDPEWVDQIASLDRDTVASHQYAIPDIEDRIVTVEVPALRLPSLIGQEGMHRIDVLHIDVEGFDDEVIAQIDMGAPWAPSYIIYERKHLDGSRYDATRERLQRGGYRMVDLWPDELAYRHAPGPRSRRRTMP